MTLRINEIFLSIQGESRTVGIPTTFIRLTGCPLRCVYCDTSYAFHDGSYMEIADILQSVADFGVSYVLVTGGEPLAQPHVHVLMQQLCDQGYYVSIETSGALDIAPIDPRVVKVMDLKTPSSQESHKNRYANLAHIQKQDQIKFVIGDHNDYQWTKEQIQQHQLNHRCEVLLSPSHGVLSPKTLAEWILEDCLPVRLQIQLHKYLEQR